MAERSIQFRTGYKRGGPVEKGGTTTAAPKKKEPGIIRKGIDKVRKKLIPTFGEQHETATKADKKTFTSTRAKDKGAGWFGPKRGKLHYATTQKKDVEKKITKAKKADAKIHHPHKKKPVYEKATGTKVSKRGQAFAAARKAGKDSFMFEGKKYHTRVKGEEKKQPGFKVDKKGITFKLPELSGGTAKKIKKFVRGRTKKQGGGRIADAARRAQIHGFYSPDMGMGGRDPRIGIRGRGPVPGMARGRGYAKGGLIKGKPKLATKGW